MWKVQIPKTESKVEEATLFKWHKKEGDSVFKGELIAEIETFKAAIDLNSPGTGIIYKLLVKEEETVPVNTIIAIIIEEGENISPENIEPFLHNQEKETTLAKNKLNIIDDQIKKIRIAPAARKFASENGVDLSLINGSGPGGAIIKEDLDRYIAKREKKNCFTIKNVHELTRVQKISAERLTYSYKNIPQFTLYRKVNISPILDLKKNSKLHKHLSLVDFVIKTLILAFKEFPGFNAVFEEEKYKYIKEINVGLAIATERGLVVPILRNLENINIFEIAQIRREITDKALSLKLEPQDFEGGTFTLTNLGLNEIEYFNPIVNPPQVAILGLGKSESYLPLCLTVDHRIIDGNMGAAFLKYFIETISSRNKLLA